MTRDKTRIYSIPQRCHTFSFGHYHQAPGASCGILYILGINCNIRHLYYSVSREYMTLGSCYRLGLGVRLGLGLGWGARARA